VNSPTATEILECARHVVRADGAAIAAALDALDDNFLAAAQAIARCTGKVLLTGSGTSGIIADRAAHLLSVGGTPAFFLPPARGLHGGLGVLGAEDIVLALSKGGSSADLNEFCKRARTLCQCLIVITADPASELAQLAHHCVRLAVPDEADLGGVVATGSSLAAASVTDAFVEVARLLRGYDWTQVLFTHPMGAVGRDAEATLRRLSTAKDG
jgi:arabinose-5-phosphate isomerase